MGSMKWDQVQTSRSDFLLGRVGEEWARWHHSHLYNWSLLSTYGEQCFGIFHSIGIKSLLPVLLHPFTPTPLFLSSHQRAHVPSVFLFYFSLRPGYSQEASRQKCPLNRDQCSGFILKAKATTSSMSVHEVKEGGIICPEQCNAAP